MRISGKRVLLTGASGGIGHAIARRLAGEGGRLVLTGRNEEALRPLADELSAQLVLSDLSSRGGVNELLQTVLAGGEVDILVANAGLPGSGDVLDFSIEQIDRALDVNLRAPMVLTRELLPAMVARGEGHIVLMSSLSGKSSQMATSIYSATKFGLRGFGQGVRADMRPHGVGVTTLFPGFISDAGMFHETGAKLPAGVGTATPEDVAAAVVKGIVKNKGELSIAPHSLRLGTAIAQLAPDLAARVSARSGKSVAEQMIPAQKHLR